MSTLYACATYTVFFTLCIIGKVQREFERVHGLVGAMFVMVEPFRSRNITSIPFLHCVLKTILCEVEDVEDAGLQHLWESE